MADRAIKSVVTRRNFLVGLGAGAAGLALAACAQPAAPAATTTAQASGKFDWMMAKGKEVRFIGLKSTIEDYWEKTVAEFQQMTGITVKFEAYEQAQARQKIATELTAGTGTLDSFRTTRAQDFAQYEKNGWFEDFTPYIGNPAKAAPDLDMADFFEGALNSCKIGGKVIALPVISGGQCLCIRKDLLEAKGLKAPTNFDELANVAKALHNPPDVYGFIGRGQKSNAVSMFAVFLHNMGVDWMGKDGKTPSLNLPEAVEAYKYYGGLLKAYAPQGIVNMGNVELTPFYQQGKAAMYPDDLSFRTQFEDPAVSKVVGKTAYVPFPAGPKRNTPTIYIYGLAVASQSKNKDAAWLWTQYLAGKQYQIKAMVAGVAAGRKSAWDDPTALSAAPKDWVDTAKWTFEKGDDQWAPPVISVPEARDIVGLPITVAIEGGDVKAACDKANADLTALAKRDGIM
ncbi:MAG: ABC transporter substrate-binding protein [Chloroflexota bacterium]